MSAGQVVSVRGSRYQPQVSFEAHDPAWDDFLASTPGGHHLQTSLWGQLKTEFGWRVGRVVVREEGRIVAGAQLLIRSLPLRFAVGYVPRGPVTTDDDPALQSLLVDELRRLARRCRVQMFAVQPATTAHAMTEPLRRAGFRPSTIELAPTATAILDLSLDEDELLAGMKSTTRYNIRRGTREGMRVREGTADDLPVLHRLLVSTSQRQQFVPEGADYLAALWRTLAPHGYAKLFLAERDDDAVSAALAIPFGDTVIYKRGAWSGRHSRSFPNEVMQWEMIRWAKAEGYRYYDFEGIDADVARAIVDEGSPEGANQGVTAFKLGFGGEARVFPEAYDYLPNPLARRAYHSLFPRAARTSLGARALRRVRGV